ncbi:2-(3-amino-3-carboxypropyl)histidine synthase subunit 2-like [Mytilus californianus]|uniref:2-(3-amino-3-carboxypropyl)histidine synthase subunit 2-like n=1 Tax=Mytilus californianus TaxID=6549 RepID=UPI00224721E9|nr:2-(3-amino-3-carboxypropyl)histidine synthase subunit 2-like [Mytilus californianus]XP_052099469.1 2-(3-amino-3-carboxypropyl)histidine synthase subunit 2-like [Mytilus californianus]
MTANFSSPDEDVISRKLDVYSGGNVSKDLLEKFYEIQDCIKWIQKNDFKKIALQMPDELMKDSVPIADKIQSQIEGKVFILGDTSYGSCCVDEITAEHYNADCIIHYGHSCMSPTRRIPVKFVFGQSPVDVPDLVSKVKDIFTDKDKLIVLLYDTCYHHVVDAIATELKHHFHNFVVSGLNFPSGNGDSNNSCHDSLSNDLSQEKSICKCNRSFKIPLNQSLDSAMMLYIGQENLTLTNLIMTLNKCCFYTYNPLNFELRKESSNVNRMLMKRFYMVEKAKDANIVGIVVGTLGVADYLKVIERLKSLIKQAGKKSYTFVVGKLNVPKLANFLEVDVYVLVACPENTLLDSSEFYKPVVSVYEMEMACNRSREWTGDYHTDFRDILPDGSDYIPLGDSDMEGTTDVSLITGKLRTIGHVTQPEVTSTSIVTRNEAMAVTTVKAENAEEFFSSRSWKGLEQNLGQTEVSDAVEGSKGIAAGYSYEQN